MLEAGAVFTVHCAPLTILQSLILCILYVKVLENTQWKPNDFSEYSELLFSERTILETAASRKQSAHCRQLPLALVAQVHSGGAHWQRQIFVDMIQR